MNTAANLAALQAADAAGVDAILYAMPIKEFQAVAKLMGISKVAVRNIPSAIRAKLRAARGEQPVVTSI